MDSDSCVDDPTVDEYLLLEFEVINWSDRKFTYDGVSFNSGETDVLEGSNEPWTYKSRGAWFDGDDLLRLEGPFYLHA